jgi:L-iditol 2-dehydrogenase
VDLALETAGVPQTLMQTIQVTRPRGVVVCGGNQPQDASLPMSFIEDLMRKEIKLVGCFMSYSAPFPGEEWTGSVRELASGQLHTNTMVSHRFPLSETPRVFEQMAARAFPYRKIILQPEE